MNLYLIMNLIKSHISGRFHQMGILHESGCQQELGTLGTFAKYNC